MPSRHRSHRAQSRQNVGIADMAKRRHMILLSDDDHDDEDDDHRSFPAKPVPLKPSPSPPFQLNISKNGKKTKSETTGTRKSSESQSISFATSK